MTDDQHHNSQPTPDLAWEAARYVWGELSPAEATAFEQRLATDELACVAVAEAVQLSAGLQAAVPAPLLAQPQRSASTFGRQLAAWVCAATATVAGIALFFAWQPTPAPAVNLATVELVDRWVAQNHRGPHAEFDIRDDMDTESEILDESLSAPHWLVNAVELTTGKSPIP